MQVDFSYILYQVRLWTTTPEDGADSIADTSPTFISHHFNLANSVSDVPEQLVTIVLDVQLVLKPHVLGLHGFHLFLQTSSVVPRLIELPLCHMEHTLQVFLMPCGDDLVVAKARGLAPAWWTVERLI